LRSLNVDNTDPPKAPWRLEATSDGRLALISSQRQGDRDGTLHVALSRDGAELVAHVRYSLPRNFRSEVELWEIFSGRPDFRLVVRGNGSFAAAPIADWARTPAGFEIVLRVPRSALLEISNAESFELSAHVWANAFREVDPSTTFGTAGFRSGAAALLRE
jgi:hypothetical protein